MVRRSWIMLTGAVLMSAVALFGATGCAQAQEEARAQERETEEDEPRFTFAFRGGSYLGVYLKDVDADAVRELDLKAERGALIERVAEDGPAAEAGLEANDVIVTWNDTAIESVAQLTRLVRETPAGRAVRLGVVRDGRTRDITVTIGTRSARGFAYGIGPEMDMAREAYDRALEGVEGLRDRFDSERFHTMFIGRPRLGVSLQSLTPQLGEFFGIDSGEGALVTTVREGSPAQEAGLRAGDVIVRIDGEAVEDPGDVMRELARHDEGEVEITVVRDKKTRTLKATLEKAERSEWRSGAAPRVYISPGDEAFDSWPMIVVPEPEVVVPEVVMPRPPRVEVGAVPVLPRRPTAPQARVRPASWQELRPTAL